MKIEKLQNSVADSEVKERGGLGRNFFRACIAGMLALVGCDGGSVNQNVQQKDGEAAVRVLEDDGEGEVFVDNAQIDKVQLFKKEQEHTQTPNGRIIMDTVEELSDGRIKYQTEDGSTWAVKVSIVKVGGEACGKYETPELYGPR